MINISDEDKKIAKYLDEYIRKECKTEDPFDLDHLAHLLIPAYLYLNNKCPPHIPLKEYRMKFLHVHEAMHQITDHAHKRLA